MQKIHKINKHAWFYFVRLNKSAYFQRQMWRSRKHDRRHVLFLKQIMQTTEYYCHISVRPINETAKNTGWPRPLRYENFP
jgi:hypothetical protein